MTDFVSLDAWVRARRDLQAAVLESCRTVNPRFEVKGSFAREDFHLDRTATTTYSDVDLRLEDDRRDRHQWEAEVAEAVARKGWKVRVSVQHHDSLAGLTPEDSRLLAVGELVRFWARITDDRFASYLFAKITLVVIRSFEPVRGAGHPRNDDPPGFRRLDPLLELARRARTGRVPHFSGAQARASLERHESDESVIVLLRLLDDRAIGDARAWFLERLPNSSVHPWLQQTLSTQLPSWR